MTPGLAALVAVIWLALGVAPLHAGANPTTLSPRAPSYLGARHQRRRRDRASALSFGDAAAASWIPVQPVSSRGQDRTSTACRRSVRQAHLLQLDRIMAGRWVVTPVTIAGADGASVTTSPIPVLAVTDRMPATARRCTTNGTRRVSMLGIGTAAQLDGPERSAKAAPANPFLGVAAISDAGANHPRRGYV